jgi:Predicted permease
VLGAGRALPDIFGIFRSIADIVPFIGPIATGAVIVLVALIDSWQKAVLVVVVFTVVQQLESNLVLPLLSQKFIAFPAILVLISLLVGEALWGLAGAILAIPLFGIVYDFVGDYLVKHRRALKCES